MPGGLGSLPAMASPVTPADIQGLIITPTAKFCLAFSKLILQLPVKIYQFINWMLDTGGDISHAFHNAITPPGTIIFSGSKNAPPYTLSCNGAAVSRTTYSDLFTKIGTSYGVGDGSTTFNVPDFRDRFPVGAGTSYQAGSTGGEATHVLTMAELPADIPPIKSGIDEFIISESSTAGVSATLTGGGGVPRKTTPAETFDNLGDGDGHNNLPPYLGVEAYIRY